MTKPEFICWLIGFAMGFVLMLSIALWLYARTRRRALKAIEEETNEILRGHARRIGHRVR